ncbi:MAG: SWF/SNF helicase family protein [Planctomycetes bacterium]|nr:SWF/SNF helicase family protein [Planctomycetota bacterium]
MRLLAFTKRHRETPGENKRLERWRGQHQEVIEHVQERHRELFGDDEDEADEDLINEEMLEDVDYLPRGEYNVPEILNETFLDLDQIAEFLNELRQFEREHDDKLKSLVTLLKSDPVLSRHKVLIFSEFADTTRYLKQQLTKAGISGIDQVDSDTKRDRAEIIRCFSPYYNASSSADLAAQGFTETRVLISTDVLSEGLNLQDAARMINYDLHWNPVRLMQRIGRVDRRLNPETEARVVADHPDQRDIRGTVIYWNFLPPDELDELLRLYTRVAHKTLRISKTFGIERQKLLRPDDDYEDLKNFNHAYEGDTTPVEEMHLELQQLLRDHPDLEARLNALPGRVFSGKEHPTAGARAVFFCFALPAADHAAARDAESGELPWTEEAGRTAWYLYDIASGSILEDATEIVRLIRSQPDTPRQCKVEQPTLAEIRAKVERHVKNTYLKQVQAPVGVKPSLKAWMELS